MKFWHNWLLNNWSKLLKWKGPRTSPHSSKLFKRLLKIIVFVYIYQLTKFGYLMSCGLNIYSKMHPASCTNIHHDVTDLVNHEIVKNTKTWISSERNITFLQNKKILNLCIRWHILRSYCFVTEETFKEVHHSAHLFIIAIGSHSQKEWKQQQIIFLHYSCSVTMINVKENLKWRKMWRKITIICEGKFMY